MGSSLSGFLALVLLFLLSSISRIYLINSFKVGHIHFWGERYSKNWYHSGFISRCSSSKVSFWPLKHSHFNRMSVEVKDICGSPFNATFKGLAINPNSSSAVSAGTNIYRCKDSRGVNNPLGCFRGFFLVIYFDLFPIKAVFLPTISWSHSTHWLSRCRSNDSFWESQGLPSSVIFWSPTSFITETLNFFLLAKIAKIPCDILVLIFTLDLGLCASLLKATFKSFVQLKQPSRACQSILELICHWYFIMI